MQTLPVTQSRTPLAHGQAALIRLARDPGPMRPEIRKLLRTAAADAQERAETLATAPRPDWYPIVPASLIRAALDQLPRNLWCGL